MVRGLFLGAVLFGLCPVVGAADKLNPFVMARVSEWQETRAREIVRLKKAGAPKARIETARAMLPAVPGVEFPLKEGMIGRWDNFHSVQCVQIVDGKSFIGRVTEPMQIVGVQNGVPVLDFPGGVMVRHLITFRGFDTSGLAEGGAVVSDALFVAVPAFDGSAAALVFEAIDLKPYCDEWARLNPDAEKPVVKQVPPARVRNPEDEAASKLKAAKTLRIKNREAGDKRLKEIVDKFPETAAAKEAAELLKK